MVIDSAANEKLFTVNRAGRLLFGNEARNILEADDDDEDASSQPLQSSGGGKGWGWGGGIPIPIPMETRLDFG